MISFGASYGNTVMTRISLLIERFDMLVSYWQMTLGIIPVMIVLIAIFSYRKT
jgi:hypothetical protein